MPINKDLINKKELEEANKLINNSRFVNIYYAFSLIAISLSTIVWSYLGSKVALYNSNQLSPTRIFHDSGIANSLIINPLHNYFIKWPLFYLTKSLNNSYWAYSLITVLLCLVSVSALVFILHKIEKRRSVLATTLLIVSSLMLMVPFPINHSLSPALNMASLTSINIEYPLFIVVLILISKMKTRICWQSVLAFLILSLLIASNRIFICLSLGGALLALIFAVVSRRWMLVKKLNSWLVISVFSVVLGGVLSTIFNSTHSVGVANIGESTYFNIIGSFSALGKGLEYLVFSIVSGLGAGPLHPAQSLSTNIGDVIKGILTPSFPAQLINLVLGLMVLVYAYKFILKIEKTNNYQARTAVFISLALMFSALSSGLLFALTKHNYAEDSGYIGILTFAILIAGSAYFSTVSLNRSKVVLVGGIATAGILLGFVGIGYNYHGYITAAGNNDPSVAIADTLASHKTSYLLGDYWSIYHEVGTNSKISPLPMLGCGMVSTISNKNSGALNPPSKRFAYLYESGSQNVCSLSDVEKVLGKPNSSVLIDGNYDSPKIMLLLYDRNLPKSKKKKPTGPSTIAPIALSDLLNTSCVGPTTMYVVAHQDDDLLFMNPDLSKDFGLNRCIRTIYLTAGDAGSGSFYWLSRETGSEAAYLRMIGLPENTPWIDHIVKLSDNEFIRVSSPKGQKNVTLIFFNLPDGNLNGAGFGSTKNQSLRKLINGNISTISSVDRQSTYSLAGLQSALEEIMNTYQPAVLRTQDTTNSTDHSDHIAAGVLSRKAFKSYTNDRYQDLVSLPIYSYKGYPIRSMPVNLTPAQISSKTSIFEAYISHDLKTCYTVNMCMANSQYGAYLSRQYKVSE